MKKIIVIIGIFAGTISASAQMLIGKDSPNGTSALLDFDDSTTNFRGIILPAVEDAASISLTPYNNGTFVFDKADQKVKYWTNTNDWTNLSEAGNASLLVENSSEEIGEGAIIGADETDAVGVLVLESEDKAMILPKIFRPHETVKSPYPGMICYDTESSTFAIFDGLVWNYWK